MKDNKKTKESAIDDGIIVAVDIGSSGVRSMAAEEQKDGTLRILGVETITKYGCIEKGLITNASEVGSLVKRCLMLLSNRIGRGSNSIEQAYLSIGGKMMQVCEVSVKRDLITRNPVSAKRLKEMENECRNKIEQRYPQYAVYNVEPIQYILDGEEQDDAPSISQRVRQIEIIYSVFVGTRENYEKVIGSFDRANLSIIHHWVRPESLLSAVVPERDWDEGVAIVDFGAQTTTVSIYRRNRFLKNKVIQLGGYHITRDIQSQNISFDLAERIKCEFGVAAVSLAKESRVLALPSTLRQGERVRLRTDFLAQIIEAREEEILTPVMEMINKYKDDICKIYITGGAAMLNGLPEYMQTFTDIPIECGTHANWLTHDAEQQYYMPNFSALIGTIANAAVYRMDHPKTEETVNKPPFKKKFGDILLDLFSDGQNDK